MTFKLIYRFRNEIHRLKLSLLQSETILNSFPRDNFTR